MKLVRCGDPASFLAKTEQFLLRKEAGNNLPLGIVHQLNQGASMGDDVFLAYVETDGQLLLAMVMTPPHNLIFSVNEVDKKVVAFTANTLFGMNVNIPGVVGEKQMVTSFIERWSTLHPCQPETVMDQRLYKLETVNPVPISEGNLILADKGHIELIADWIQAFTKYTPEPELLEKDALKKADLFITENSIYLWVVHGRPVSMARKARPTKNGIVINYVYTPAEHRNKGYASSCVALQCQQLLKEYQFCTLYTDLSNPVSNHIYQEIGFKPLIDSLVIRC
ncbi:GNAT family N-acetyltransferase [Bacillus sp. T33-2]|uniref:GNAT family N-acetyltransferase n=1 Tax=Bacillus sp. T33-2 TaxID=2054168 RepID=UPI000C781895|nr:GNAT family N-acetyltransferase [Bacillus sp. T33-2]PLR95545.1 hypothetical protein CVD19_14120 [Bacillus sp. T33-2]